MATPKEFVNKLMNLLGFLGEITYRPMMGEYLIYYKGVLIGGIYDSRFLIKRTLNNSGFKLLEQIPYAGAKPMYYINDFDDINELSKIIEVTYNDLKR